MTERPDLRRHGVALQLQRPGAPLLPAPRRRPGRPPGEPAPEGRAQRAEPRHRQARARPRSLPIAANATARAIQVAEVPPGPPVLQTLVAEVYGPDPARRLELAAQVQGHLRAARPAWWTSTGTSRRRSPKIGLDVDEEKAAAAGVHAGGAWPRVVAHGRRRRSRRASLHDDAGPRGRADRAAAAARPTADRSTPSRRPRSRAPRRSPSASSTGRRGRRWSRRACITRTCSR